MKKVVTMLIMCLACCANVERGAVNGDDEQVFSARTIVLEFTPWLEIQPWWLGGPTIDLAYTEMAVFESLAVDETYIVDDTAVTDDTLYFPFWVRSYRVSGRIKVGKQLRAVRNSSKPID